MPTIITRESNTHNNFFVCFIVSPFIKNYLCFGTILSAPPMYIRRASGILTVPSA